MQRYADHQGAQICAAGNDPKADDPIVPESAQHHGALGAVGGHIGELADSRIGKVRDGGAALSGGTTLGEHAPSLRRSVSVVEHGQRADRLAGTEQPAVRTAWRPCAAARIAHPRGDRIELAIKLRHQQLLGSQGSCHGDQQRRQGDQRRHPDDELPPQGATAKRRCPRQRFRRTRWAGGWGGVGRPAAGQA